MSPNLQPLIDNNTDTQTRAEYAAAAFAAMSENEQAEFCISIRSPQRPCFCTTGIVCTENHCVDRPNCVEPEDVDYGHLLNDYTPSEKSAEESAAEEPTNESAADESVANEPAEEPAAEESPAEEPAEEIAEEPAKPETKTVCRSFANGINPDNTQWGRIGASEAGVGETEYAAIRAAIRICENDGLTECQTDLEVECEEVLDTITKPAEIPFPRRFFCGDFRNSGGSLYLLLVCLYNRCRAGGWLFADIQMRR